VLKSKNRLEEAEPEKFCTEVNVRLLIKIREIEIFKKCFYVKLLKDFNNPIKNTQTNMTKSKE
jgi:hypothetical protein